MIRCLMHLLAFKGLYAAGYGQPYAGSCIRAGRQLACEV